MKRNDAIVLAASAATVGWSVWALTRPQPNALASDMASQVVTYRFVTVHLRSKNGRWEADWPMPRDTTGRYVVRQRIERATSEEALRDARRSIDRLYETYGSPFLRTVGVVQWRS